MLKSVLDILAEAATDTLLKSGCVNPPCYDSILFEQLTSDLIRWPALHTHGAAGPSGVDAYAWRLCSSLGYASVALCNTLATVARHLLYSVRVVNLDDLHSLSFDIVKASVPNSIHFSC